jgi:hypothetical protein
MDLLNSHLKKMQETASAPFYNIQVLKYDVRVGTSSHLDLALGRIFCWVVKQLHEPCGNHYCRNHTAEITNLKLCDPRAPRNPDKSVS